MEFKTCRHCGFEYRPPKQEGWYPLEQSKQWQGLTDEEIKSVHAALPCTYFHTEYAKAIEAKLKEKNT